MSDFMRENNVRFDLICMLIKLGIVEGGVYIDTPIGPINEKYFQGYPNVVPGTRQLSIRFHHNPKRRRPPE